MIHLAPWLWIVIIITWLPLGFLGRGITKFFFVNYWPNGWSRVDEILTDLFALFGPVGLFSMFMAIIFCTKKGERIGFKL